MDVGVCILSWNTLSTVQRTVSLLCQERQNELPDIRIVIFDQGSTDGTRPWLASLHDPGIEVIQSPVNVGNSIGRNQMIAALGGCEFVLLLDGDIVPICGSVKSLLGAMLHEPESTFCLGYDHNGYSKQIDRCTPFELEITSQDIEAVDIYGSLTLTQYGLFRRRFLVEHPFPEFPPFDRPGWGCEDNIIGVVAEKGGLATKVVKNRVYFHDAHSSYRHLHNDDPAFSFKLTYNARLVVLQYFINVLTYDEGRSALLTRSLPKRYVPLRPYVFSRGQNLGDLLFAPLVASSFPFIEFIQKPSLRDRVFLGGSVFQHLAGQFKPGDRAEYLGVGLAYESEADSKPDCSYRVFPRGPISQETLCKKGWKTCEFVGDTAFLLAAFSPVLTMNPEGPLLEVADAYSADFCAGNIAVARTELTHNRFPMANQPEQWINKLADCRGVISSQIHPVIISLALGIPARLVNKGDLRHSEIQELLEQDLTSRMLTVEEAQQCRGKMQKMAVWKWSEAFFQIIKDFGPTGKIKFKTA